MLTALMLIASLEQATALYADVSAGAWVDTNVNHASQSADQQAAGVFDATLVLGLEHAWRPVSAWLEAGYDFTYYPAFSDFTSHAGSLSLGGSWELPAQLDLRVSAAVSGVAYGDSARDSLLAGGMLGLRWRAASWLRVSVGGGPSTRQARDAVFGANTWRANATISVLPTAWLNVSAGYALVSTDTVLYVTTTTTSTTTRGRGRGRQVTTFGQSELAVREPAWMHLGMLSLTFNLPLEIYANASYSGGPVSTPSQSYIDHVISIRAGKLF